MINNVNFGGSSAGLGAKASKVAFYLENESIPDVDLSDPVLGNPGCGGTEFMFAALPYYLASFAENSYEPILLANHVHRLPGKVPHFKVKDVIDAVRQAKALGCSIFVYRPRRQLDATLLDLIDALQLPTLAWAHITPNGRHLRALSRSRYVKALICVEREQHDQAFDTAVWAKLTYIINGFDLSGFQLPNPPLKDPSLVVYLGALVPQKGFHLLAKAWPKILERSPHARLSVIGTGALYNANASLGSWGIAERSYEEHYIAPYLAGKDGHPHSSVKFLGRLGPEKKGILYQALVGVPNPSGQTENCPGSALEFQACGTAVVSGAFYGMLDTVRHGETGLLGLSEEQLIENICSLLENPDRALALGQNGVSFIDERYNFPRVINSWVELFDRINQGLGPKRMQIKLNLHRHHKLLIVINRMLQMAFGRVISWPSVVEIKSILVDMRHRLTLWNKA